MNLTETEELRLPECRQINMSAHLLNGSSNLGWSPHYADGGSLAS